MKISLEFFNDRRLVILGLINLLTLAVLVFLVWLVLARNTKLNRDYQTLSQFATTQENWRQIMGTWSNTATARQVIDDYFITPASLPIFIERLESVAAGAGTKLKLTAVEILPGPPASLRVALTASGGWRSVLDFWKLVDRLPALITVDKLQLTARSVTNQTDDWSLSAAFQVFNFQNHDN